MMAANEDEAEQQPGVSSLQQQQMQRPAKVQLGEFWPQAPNAWFTVAELKFEVANVTGERESFAHAVSAMASACCVLLLTSWSTRQLAHQLMPVQKATRCLQVVADSNQHP